MLIFNPTLDYNTCQGKGTYTYSKIVKNTQSGRKSFVPVG